MACSPLSSSYSGDGGLFSGAAVFLDAAVVAAVFAIFGALVASGACLAAWGAGLAGVATTSAVFLAFFTFYGANASGFAASCFTGAAFWTDLAGAAAFAYFLDDFAS